jgi:hypothetical protein
VTEGLADSDRVIVSGTQSARPESQVNAVPYGAPDDATASTGGSPSTAAPARQ